jgi:hypothetical protein
MRFTSAWLEARILSNTSKALIIPALVSALMLVTGLVMANEQSTVEDQGRNAGKSAAHAALDEKADLPSGSPRLPDQITDPARAALEKNSATARREAARKAHGQGQRRVGEDTKAARLDAADRAAQGAIATAVRNANADSHAAAGQARAAAAKAAAAARHSTSPPHPGQTNRP